MSGERESPPGRCAHCGYDLAGLPGEICPECGRTQPPPRPVRLVRPYPVWIGACVFCAAAFAGLSRLALAMGVALGSEYTGDLELVPFIVSFAVVSAMYALAAWELYLRRSRLRRVEPGRVVGGTLLLVVLGVAAAVLAFMFIAVWTRFG